MGFETPSFQFLHSGSLWVVHLHSQHKKPTLMELQVTMATENKRTFEYLSLLEQEIVIRFMNLNIFLGEMRIKEELLQQ